MKLIIAIIILIIGITGSNESSTNNTDSTSSSTPSIEVEKQAKDTVIYEEVKTSTFIKAFDDNQLAAEKQYKDKGIKLTAKIKNISEDIVGHPFLSLEPGNA